MTNARTQGVILALLNEVELKVVCVTVIFKKHAAFFEINISVVRK